MKPTRLAVKLASVRAKLRFTQDGMAEAFQARMWLSTSEDVSKSEKGEREPSLIVLLRYSRLAKVQMKVFADDKLDLTQ